MTRGHYSTKQKDEILNVVQNMNCEFRVKDIFEMVSDVSLTTIYRYMDQLEKDGFISKRIGPDGETTYQYLEKCDCDHFYLRCEKCGSLTHVECSFVQELKKHIVEDHKFHLDQNHMIMNGICNNCFKELY